jgi:putative heme-binding domain-containing protein
LAVALTEAHIAPADLTQDLVRRAYALKVTDLDQSLLRHWGVARQTPRDKRRLIGKLKSQLQKTLKSSKVNRSNGRLLYNNLCLSCHRLHDAGGSLGPDLTGSNRSDLNYLLENIVDPNAAVDKSYILQTIRTTDDRVLSGVIQNSDKTSVFLKTVTGPIQVSRNEIAKMVNSKTSAMPEGLLQGLKPDQIRDLIAYLQSKEQVPLGKTPEQK